MRASFTPRVAQATLRSRNVRKPTLWTILAATALAFPARQAGADSPVSFNRDIRGILSNNCFKCHGPDPGQRKGVNQPLRLDMAEGATADLGGYAAIVPGKPAESAVIQRITSRDESEVMPPKSTGKKLAPREIELLKTW